MGQASQEGGHEGDVVTVGEKAVPSGGLLRPQGQGSLPQLEIP